MRNFELLGFVANNNAAINLESTVIVACQHFLESNKEMFLQLRKNGLQAENVYLIPKSYSYNDTIAQELIEQGFNVCQYSYNSHIPFDKLIGETLKNYLITLVNTGVFQNKQILLVDDGGHLISEAQRLGLENVVAVEQTSSGYNRIPQNVTFPVVNVARSGAKLHYESPYIADCFIDNLQHLLTKENLKPKKALIIGGGPIGKEIQQKLTIKSHIYDLNKTHSEFKDKELLSVLHCYDLIIGATGNTSIPKEYHYALKKGVILASISSSDREFDAVHIRTKQMQNQEVHKHYRTKDLLLVNSGFPFTFTGSRIAVPNKHIQLTQALMMQGIMQAVTSKNIGLEKLSEEQQEKLCAEYKKLL